MPLDSRQFVKEIITTSAWCMETLQAVSQLNLPDWAIGAGFVRNTVWDNLHGYDKLTPLADIDVLYFDREDIERQRELETEDALRSEFPNRPWSVRNQARMHFRNNDCEYRNTEDAISHWLETPTCVAVRLDGNGNLHVIAPYGLDDLLGLHVRPTPMGRNKYDQYIARVQKKNWSRHWPQVEIEGLAVSNSMSGP